MILKAFVLLLFMPLISENSYILLLYMKITCLANLWLLLLIKLKHIVIPLTSNQYLFESKFMYNYI